MIMYTARIKGHTQVKYFKPATVAGLTGKFYREEDNFKVYAEDALTDIQTVFDSAGISYNPKTHKVVPIDACLCKETFTPPLSEPTEFGAMVEADFYYRPGQPISRARWVKTLTFWISEFGHGRDWSDLINPTPIERGSK